MISNGLPSPGLANGVLATITESREHSFEFVALPGGWARLLGLMLLSALFAFVFWMYRREARSGATRRLRLSLATIRCTVLLALALIWLQPVIASYTVRHLRAVVGVLVDVSASMSIAGEDPADPSATRLQRVQRLLTRDDAAWLVHLAARNELVLLTFGAQTRDIRLPAPPDDSSNATPDAPDERISLADAFSRSENYTDLGHAVRRLSELAAESPLAGVVVLSDGAINRGLQPEEIAAALRNQSARLFAVAVGEPQEPPNLQVTQLSAPPTVPKGDPIEVRVELSARGLPPGNVEIELSSAPADGAGEPKVLERKSVELHGDAAVAEARFTIAADQPGERILRARVAPLSGEAVAVDNQREAPIHVLDERLRVLFIAGRPSYEYRYLSRLLERDKTIDVACWLQSADEEAIRDGDIQLSELPRKPEDIFTYDAAILMDANPQDFDSALALALRRFVDELGGGLLFAAGTHYSARFLSDERLSELIGILPITADPEAESQLNNTGAYRTRAVPLVQPPDTRSHPLAALSSDAAGTSAVWQALPGVWWHLPVLREKPVAAVVLRVAPQGAAEKGGVLLAVQPFGSGRAAFLGFDGTWRWRAHAEPQFNRFWVQLVRYLAQARREGTNKRGAIVIDQDALEVGEFFRVEARLLDEQFAPWQAEQISATLAAGDEAPHEVVLHAQPGREGWFAGRASVDHGGAWMLRVRLPENDTPASGPAQDTDLVKRLLVSQPQIELQNLRLHEENLTQLAQQTGGRYLRIAQAADLPNEIENLSQTKRYSGPVRPLWDHGWTMALLATLLGVEWALRRRNHLL